MSLSYTLIKTYSEYIPRILKDFMLTFLTMPFLDLGNYAVWLAMAYAFVLNFAVRARTDVIMHSAKALVCTTRPY